MTRLIDPSPSPRNAPFDNDDDDDDVDRRSTISFAFLCFHFLSPHPRSKHPPPPKCPTPTPSSSSPTTSNSPSSNGSAQRRSNSPATPKTATSRARSTNSARASKPSRKPATSRTSPPPPLPHQPLTPTPPFRKSSTLASLQQQYRDLSSQFHGFPTPASTSTTLTSPNDPSLAADFAHAQSSKSAHHPQKSVRFSSPASDLEAQHPPPPHPLFPYRDDPEPAAPPVDNVQLHAYHQQVLDEQDAQLDVLGASISRQRELSMRIGDELDEQVVMLDESERVTERHQGALDRARRRVDGFARSAGESGQMVAIVVLIVILVLLIAILK